ncbi:MAG: dockerin type I repeat-containing protein [Acutalibacteraceae bacterium]
MKKMLSMLICFAIAFSVISSSVYAVTDSQYVPTAAESGDADANGAVNLLDLILLRKYIAKWDVAPCYERADLNGDAKVNLLDLILLRKALAKWEVELCGAFAANDSDVTQSLDYIGLLNKSQWSDSAGYDAIIARMPYDMVAYDHKVFISCGNYKTNQGPVSLRYVTRDADKFSLADKLQTEQVSKFYIFNDRLFATGVDPKQWGVGQFYEYDTDTRSWIVRNVFGGQLHCYDMVYFGGKYFFAGSNVKDTDNKELYPMSVFKNTTDELTGSMLNYETVPFYDKDGNEISLDPDKFSGAPRIYELMEFDGELYAFNYDWYVTDESLLPTDVNNFNGVYKYNIDKDCFEFCEDLSFYEKFLNVPFLKDHEAIMKDFEWNGEYICINDGILVTKDFANWEKRTIDGYEDYIARDCEVIGDKAYVLANVKTDDGKWINCIFETEDFKSYRPILHFDTADFARSFAYTDGAFFFGIGTSYYNASTECGKIYRYVYYK